MGHPRMGEPDCSLDPRLTPNLQRVADWLTSTLRRDWVTNVSNQANDTPDDGSLETPRDQGRSRSGQTRSRLLTLVGAAIIVLVVGYGAFMILGPNDPDPHKVSAQRVADSLMKNFAPPPGAQQGGKSKLLDGLDSGPEAPGFRAVVRTKRWHGTGDAMKVARDIAAHPPAGLTVSDSTPMRAGNGLIYVWFSSDERSETDPGDKADARLEPTRPTMTLPEGVRSAGFNVAVVNTGANTFALRARAAVSWAPTRTADSQIPAQAAKVIISRHDSSTPGATLQNPVTVTDAADVAKIVRLVNGLDEGPDVTSAIDCVGHPDTDFGVYQVEFRTSGNEPLARAKVETDGCRFVTLTVHDDEVGRFWGTRELAVLVHRLHG